MRISASQLVPREHTPTGPVEWPRWVNGKVVMTRIPASMIPAGWQSVQVRVPSRLGSCEEAECANHAQGWTEIQRAGQLVSWRTGHVSADEAAAIYGLFGPLSLPPTVVHHDAGTDCPEVHKVHSGLPPVYIVNGRTVLWNEFEDAIGGGVHRMQQLIREGRN